MLTSPLMLVVGGLVALTAGGELLVRGSSRLAQRASISPLAIGLTVVAFGTSAPELAVSVRSVLAGNVDLAAGNVVGSNIFNVLVILGLSALVRPLVVHRRLVRQDVPLMIGVSLLVWGLGTGGRIGRLEGGLLVLGIVAFTAYQLWAARRAGVRNPEQDSDRLASAASRPSIPGAAVTVLGGLLLLTAGAGWLVKGAATLARSAGVSELVIGLTILAAGTSLPELVTSFVATLRGELDIAVGNIVGSNVFNLLGVLGTAALLGPRGVELSSAVLGLDFPMMTAVAVACLPIFLTGYRIDRWEGALFVGYYAFYLGVLLGTAKGISLPAFVVPLLLISLPGLTIGSVLLQRTVRRRPSAPGGGS